MCYGALTKILTWSVLRFSVLLKDTYCPAKGHLMVFQSHRITLMYCRSKDKTGALAHVLKKSANQKKIIKAYQKSVVVPVVAKDKILVT